MIIPEQFKPSSFLVVNQIQKKMTIRKNKTTKVNKPKADKKKYTPQKPDNNRPDLGRPTQEPTAATKKKPRK